MISINDMNISSYASYSKENNHIFQQLKKKGKMFHLQEKYYISQ